MSRPDFSLEPLRENLLDLVLQWRNSERVRAASFGDHAISRTEHLAWFERLKIDPSRRAFVFFMGTKPLGFVQFKNVGAKSDSTEWGFYVGDQNAPRGAGRTMGFAALNWAFGEATVASVIGRTLASNERSERFHERMGFHRIDSETSVTMKGSRPVEAHVWRLSAEDWKQRRAEVERACSQEGVSFRRT